MAVRKWWLFVLAAVVGATLLGAAVVYSARTTMSTELLALADIKAELTLIRLPSPVEEVESLDVERCTVDSAYGASGPAALRRYRTSSTEQGTASAVEASLRDNGWRLVQNDEPPPSQPNDISQHYLKVQPEGLMRLDMRISHDETRSVSLEITAFADDSGRPCGILERLLG